MKRTQKPKIKWGEGRILAAALCLMLVLCLLTAMNRLPREITVAPVHAVSADLAYLNRVDLNSASMDRLMSLPSVGETLARRVIDGRPYASVDDLLRIEGIGEGILIEIRDLVRAS